MMDVLNLTTTKTTEKIKIDLFKITITINILLKRYLSKT